MGYIVKDTQGLIVSRITDVGRRKISQGNFNIKYFQIGDSEINYGGLQLNGVQNETLASQSQVLEPSYNAQNNVGNPQSNKNEIKYPFYLKGSSGLTYGIPYEASSIDDVFNTASPLGFFNITNNISYAPIFTSITYNSRFYIGNTSSIGNTNILTLTQTVACSNLSGTISAGTIVTLFFKASSSNVPAGCSNFFDSRGYVVLTYKVLDISLSPTQIVLDRNLPDLTQYNGIGYVFFYYGKLRDGFDSPTPLNYWSQSVINYESLCTPDNGYVKIWNMNIPWSESPAGTNPNGSTNPPIPEYNEFGSFSYLGTKEYYGYMSSEGQFFVNGYKYSTTSTTTTEVINTANEIISIEPEDQKAIAIIHYTNNSIIDFYGEKFATELESEDDIGLGSNFKIHLPWIMWHKNNSPNTKGLTLYINPPFPQTFGGEWMVPFYLKSKKNQDMNSPGIRYYKLFDDNQNVNRSNNPNCVGKVFPDDKIIIIDDEELVAAMTYLSNRNYTLPAPRVKTIAPSTSTSNEGLLASDSETLWVTYRFRLGGFQGIHCNYYMKVLGPSIDCNLQSQDVIVDFKNTTINPFPYMKDYVSDPNSLGWAATGFDLIVQRVETGLRPNPKAWKVINYDSYLVQTGVKDNITSYINPSIFRTSTFTINRTSYNSAPFYDIQSQIQITSRGQEGLKFGDEYYFYGNIETDIQATIYQMKYLINLPNNQFTNNSNPSYQEGNRYMSEIGLYDEDKNLLVLSKFNSPQIRRDVQRITIKLDF